MRRRKRVREKGDGEGAKEAGEFNYKERGGKWKGAYVRFKMGEE